MIDAKDARFGELKVWVDGNGNGVTDAGELKSLGDLGIQSIGLSARHLEGSAKIGQNALVSTVAFTRTDGTTGTAGAAALAFRTTVGPVTTPASKTDLGITENSIGRERAERLISALSAHGDDPFAIMVEQVGGLHRHIWGDPVAVTDDSSISFSDTASAGTSDARTDSLLALITQDMATFGASKGDNDLGRKHQTVMPFDFFAWTKFVGARRPRYMNERQVPGIEKPALSDLNGRLLDTRYANCPVI